MEVKRVLVLLQSCVEQESDIQETKISCQVPFLY